MSDEKLNTTVTAADEAPEKGDKKTLKEVVLDGLEEKGRGKDKWLW